MFKISHVDCFILLSPASLSFRRKETSRVVLYGVRLNLPWFSEDIVKVNDILGQHEVCIVEFLSTQQELLASEGWKLVIGSWA
jgi:hypothetical protein